MRFQVSEKLCFLPCEVPDSSSREDKPLCNVAVSINMGNSQNYGPLLEPCFNTAPSIQGTQKGIIILTTTHTGTPNTEPNRLQGVFLNSDPAKRNPQLKLTNL